MNKDTQIEDLFSSAFGSEELAPPSSLMGGIFSALDQQKVEDLYRDAFMQEEVAPSPSVWPRISRALWLTAFLTFSYNRLNIYYVAGIIGAASLLLLPNSAPVMPQIIESPQAKEQVRSASVEQPRPSPLANPQVDAHKPAPADAQRTRSAQISPRTPSPAAPNNTDTAASVKYSVVGNEIVCLGSTQTYVITPAFEQSYIAVDTSAARIMPGGEVQFFKEGRYTVAFMDKNTDDTLCSIEISVGRPLAAEILGDAIICQDAPNHTFRVNSRKDIGIQYVWEMANNSHRIIGNGYISIIASAVGVDTLYLTQIDKNTGCVSYRTRAVRVLSKPSAAFVPEGRGNFMIELMTAQQHGSMSHWFVNDQPVDASDNLIRFDGVGTYRISHVVVDQNSCTDTSAQDIEVDAYSLYIPNAFVPTASNGEFKPTGNGLAEYRIEIFNADNQKLWESTTLTGGQPSQGWDGYYNGELQKPGTYFFNISARFENGDEWKGVEKGGTFSKTGKFYLFQK